jgi:G:T-mismatch repair DNA endonuclease (very short patch repair protein)
MKNLLKSRKNTPFYLKKIVGNIILDRNEVENKQQIHDWDNLILWGGASEMKSGKLMA